MEEFNSFGPLCKVIREGRPGAPKGAEVMAGLCGFENLDSGATTIRTFERGARPLNAVRWDGYLAGLSLHPEQADILHKMYEGVSETESNESKLENYSFETIAHGQDPKLNALREQLRNLEYPAFVMDELWFVHALNASIIKLFDMNEEYLSKRWAWHVIATKYHSKSPVRRALREPLVDNQGNPVLDAYGEPVGPDRVEYGRGYFQAVVGEFLNQISRYFFTEQATRLRRYLCQLSAASNTGFQTLWDGLITMRTPFPATASLPRDIYYQQDKRIKMAILYASPIKVETLDGHTVKYTLARWLAEDEAARTARDEIKADLAHLPPGHRIRYAWDCGIPDYNVTDWSEVFGGDNSNGF